MGCGCLVQIMCSYTTIGLNIGTGRLLQVIGCNWYEATCGFLKVYICVFHLFVSQGVLSQGHTWCWENKQV